MMTTTANKDCANAGELVVALQQQQAVLEVMGRLQTEFFSQCERSSTWNRLLDDILQITSSTFGLVGVVNLTPQGQSILETITLTDIAWDADKRQRLEAKSADGFEFLNVKNYLEAVLTNGKLVLINDNSSDPLRAGLPQGQPPLQSFLGLPIQHDGELLAVLGIANRAGGYQLSVANMLQPLLRSVGQLIVAARTANSLLVDQERLSYVLAATSEGIWDYDVPSGRIRHNTKWANLVGYQLRDFSHESDYIAVRIHPQDQKRALAELNEAYSQDEVFQIEYRILRPEGNYIWLLDRGRVVERDAQGQPLRVIGSIQDITERKAADAHMELVSRVFMHAREGILVTDMHGRIIDVNETFCAVTGYRRDEVLGKSASLLKSGRHDASFFEQLWESIEITGQWSGEVWDKRKNGEIYPSSLTVSLLPGKQGQEKRYVGVFSDVSSQKEQELRFAKVAHYDQLTGLANRLLMTERLRLAMAMARGGVHPLAVAVIDLDGFKAINEQHGNDLGNQVLITVSSRLRELLRSDDTIGRFGGDEFVVMLASQQEQSNSIATVQRLLDALEEPIQLGMLTLQVSGSAGITLYPQLDEVDADQLLRQADQAMYQAKLAGKNHCLVFDQERHRNLRGHQMQVDRIKVALSCHQFVLHYQPKVNMRTGKVLGAEALVRWQHPERGLLPPAVFLPFIEQNALEIELGRWVIDAALAQISQWHSDGLTLPVSVNIDGFHLQHPDFFDELKAHLSRYPTVQPHLLEIEVLESSTLGDIDCISQLISDCRTLGVYTSLDDFGTGYSSLSYLKRIPARVLKIDQSFVRDMLHDPDDLAILEGVLGMAKAFKLGVIAEGVETLTHGKQLLQLGCEQAQGYGIARPMAPGQVQAWVASWIPHQLWTQTRKINSEALPLLYATVEHRAWFRNTTKQLTGEVHRRNELDASRCHFGQWLASQKTNGTFDPRRLEPIEEVHHRLHELTCELIDRHAIGHIGATAAQVSELQVKSDLLIEMMCGLLDTL